MGSANASAAPHGRGPRSEEHTSELQSHSDLVCRLLLEKKKTVQHSVINVDAALAKRAAEKVSSGRSRRGNRGDHPLDRAHELSRSDRQTDYQRPCRSRL